MTLDDANPLSADLDEITAALSVRMESLKGMRLLITGGTGFFGRWLLESIAWMNLRLQLGIRATVLSRNPARLTHIAPHLAADSTFRFVAGDVRALPSDLGRFDYIVHAATSTTTQFDGDEPLALIDTIVQGTRNVLELAAQSECRGLLLTSSGAVYGKQPLDLDHIAEDSTNAPDCLNPASAYGEAKRLAETLCGVYAARRGVPCKIARCFAFVGPFLPLDAHFAIGNFLRDGLNGDAIQVQGDGTPLRSYMYAADLCIWLWTLLVAGKTGVAYNVGSERAISIASTASAVAASFSPAPTVAIAKAAIAGGAPQRYVPSTRLAREELGLRLNVDLDDAIRRTVAYYRAVAS